MQDASSVFAPWANFYVIVGSSSAALTGLMFVVVTLSAQRGTNAQERSVGFSAFSTPTVVHFCSAFLVAGILSAPWRSLAPPCVLMILIGICGILYALRFMYLAKRFTQYQMLLDDLIWYGIVPFLLYAIVVTVGILLPRDPGTLLFALAGATISLVIVGIRNAWDVVTFLAFQTGDD
jgi:hypothetical protein